MERDCAVEVHPVSVRSPTPIHFRYNSHSNPIGFSPVTHSASRKFLVPDYACVYIRSDTVCVGCTPGAISQIDGEKASSSGQS